MRLIDADAVLESKWWDGLRSEFDKARAKIIVMSARTIDAVPVVRCSECKFAQCVDDNEPMYICLNPKQYSYCSRGSIVCESTHYCGYGERKEDTK